MFDHDKECYKKELIDLMRRVDQVLRAESIEYFAMDGTCLGAAREKGIIPWDEDIDLAVRRRDFKRALEVLNNSGLGLYASGVQGNKIESNPRWGRVFNRIDSTSSIERRRAYIDLDVIDYAPENRLIFLLQSLFLVGLRRIVERRESKRVVGSSLLYFVADLIALPFRVLSSKWLVNWTYDIWVSCSESNWVKRTYDGNRKRYPANAFRSSVRMPFNEIEISVPIGYETYLTICYGDWRTPPPPERRMSHVFTGVNGTWSVPLPSDGERLLI